MSFDVVPLKTLIDAFSVEELKQVFSKFESPNVDVGRFFRETCFQFDKVGISRTLVVFTRYQGEKVIVGYFSLALKPLTIERGSWKRLSAGVHRKLLPIGSTDLRQNYEVSSILLGQLGVNFQYHHDGLKLISGEELLGLVYDHVKQVQNVIGGVILYVEADNEPHLRDFYKGNGFSQLLMRENEDSKMPTLPYLTKNKQHLYIKKINDIV